MENTDVNGTMPETMPETQPETPLETTKTESVFTVPDAYKEAGWANNIKSYDDLWTQHANAQKLIGKKTIGIPTADSSDNDVEEFYAKLRPETVDGYDFDLGSDTPIFKDIFHKNGLTNRQAKSIADAYKKQVDKVTEELYSKDGFNNVMTKNLGENYKEKVDKVNGFLKQYGSKSALAEIDQLPNETLGLVYNLINLTMDKYAVTELGSVSTKHDAVQSDNLVEYMAEMEKMKRNPFQTTEQINSIKRRYGIIK